MEKPEGNRFPSAGAIFPGEGLRLYAWRNTDVSRGQSNRRL